VGYSELIMVQNSVLECNINSCVYYGVW